jgi:aryl-alcohol dehydrogenase-like predicted oxidoreductase
MRYRILGHTDLRVSEIGLGCWALGGVGWGPVDDLDSLATIRRAVDCGITFFDTSDSYGNGHSEELIGRALEGSTADVVICTKGGILPEATRQDFSAVHLVRALDQSLRRLRRDCVDLYLLHNPDRETLERGDAFRTLERLRRDGKLRHWGVSVRPRRSWRSPPSGTSEDPVADARWLIEDGRAAAVELVYNMLEPEAATVFDLAMTRGTGLIARVPLASGLLTGKFSAGTEFPKGDFRRRWPPDELSADLAALARIRDLPALRDMDVVQAALQFCLWHPAVAVTIPGARTPAQVERNASASKLPRFEAGLVADVLARGRVMSAN